MVNKLLIFAGVLFLRAAAILSVEHRDRGGS